MKRNHITKSAAIIFALCILCLSLFIPASAVEDQQKGSVNILVDSSFEGIPLNIVKVGKLSSGKMELDAPYSGLGVDLSTTTTEKEHYAAADTLAAYVKEKDILGTVARIDPDGYAKAGDLDADSLYLVMQPVGHELVTVQNIIISIPTNDKKTGEPVYDLDIKAKYVDNLKEKSRASIILNKLNKSDEPLADAVFSFWHKIYYTDASKVPENVETGTDETGDFYWREEYDSLTTDKNGQITVTGIPFGDYRFVEEKAPENYILDSTPHDLTLSVSGTIKTENEKFVPDEGEPQVLDIYNESKITESSEAESKPESSETQSITEVSEESGYESSEPESQLISTPEESELSVPEESETPEWQITGQDIMIFVITGIVVGVSLIVVILMIVLGKKNKKDE